MRVFTGIIEEQGRVTHVVPRGPGRTLTIAAPLIAEGVAIGDSIALDGCCLTVIEHHGDRLTFEAGPETLARTTLGQLAPDHTLNLERAVALGTRLGGHFVTGHVDAVGAVASRHDDHDWSTFWFDCPATLTRQMASKGSIAVDGISLTLVEVTSASFSVALIPHTLRVTTLGRKQTGDRVNLETDLLAKYVQQQLIGFTNPA